MNQVNPQIETPEYDIHEEFIEVNTNCTLCGSALHFEYEEAESDHTIVEKCECPSCGLKGSNKTHTLN